MSDLMHPGSDIWCDVSFSYLDTSASAKDSLIMGHLSYYGMIFGAKDSGIA